MSYLIELRCSHCKKAFAADRLQTYCADCQAPLVAHYDLDAARGALDRDAFQSHPRGMWRWHDLLPIHHDENRLDLGEGDTPLLPAPNLGSALGLSHLYIKDESFNPTGTFKARGMAAAISKAKELGVTKIAVPTAGNAGGAMAAYAARGGLEAHIFMPQDTPKANIEECRMMGAEVICVAGLISDAAHAMQSKAAVEGWFDLSTFKEPYRPEGKKIMAYELAESFDWRLPDVIVYPTGGGTGLVAMWQAFTEMGALGWLESDHKPRMVVVQADGCAPVIKAFESGADCCEFWPGAQTIASGLRVPISFASPMILDTLRASQGTAVAVSDEKILAAQKKLATEEGIFAAPEGAATLAGLQLLMDQRWINRDEKIVLFNTGTGLKYI
jgi:threonine synthase